MSIGALILTAVWILNNERVNEYISYYWKRLQWLEEKFEIDESTRIFSVIFNIMPEGRYPGSYRQYARILPPVFLCGWL
jgi:hypothetical protein